MNFELIALGFLMAATAGLYTLTLIQKKKCMEQEKESQRARIKRAYDIATGKAGPSCFEKHEGDY